MGREGLGAQPMDVWKSADAPNPGQMTRLTHQAIQKSLLLISFSNRYRFLVEIRSHGNTFTFLLQKVRQIRPPLLQEGGRDLDKDRLGQRTQHGPWHGPWTGATGTKTGAASDTGVYTGQQTLQPGEGGETHLPQALRWSCRALS